MTFTNRLYHTQCKCYIKNDVNIDFIFFFKGSEILLKENIYWQNISEKKLYQEQAPKLNVPLVYVLKMCIKL